MKEWGESTESGEPRPGAVNSSDANASGVLSHMTDRDVTIKGNRRKSREVRDPNREYGVAALAAMGGMSIPFTPDRPPACGRKDIFESLMRHSH